MKRNNFESRSPVEEKHFLILSKQPIAFQTQLHKPRRKKWKKTDVEKQTRFSQMKCLSSSRQCQEQDREKLEMEKELLKQREVVDDDKLNNLMHSEYKLDAEFERYTRAHLEVVNVDQATVKAAAVHQFCKRKRKQISKARSTTQ